MQNKVNKILITIVAVIGVTVIGVLGVFSPYLLSFVIKNGSPQFVFFDDSTYFDALYGQQGEVMNIRDENYGWFNYYGIEYRSDCYLKAELTYFAGVKKITEEFFLEPTTDKKEFFSFVDGAMENKRGNKLESLRLQSITEGKSFFTVCNFYVYNREVPDREIFVESDNLKIGVDLLWGGALSYVEDLNSNVEAVEVDGLIKVDSNASERYNAKVVNKNVNLINRNDTGRLVQQSYYGTLEYDYGVYMDTDWRYNPVQGGNQFNDASKIVDLKVTDNTIYVKCRPLDWAKEKEFITPSYMEATYAIENGAVHAKCRFVDFSGYPEAASTQETPAFYCIEPFNNFVYYGGDKPWTNDKLTSEPDLIFWPDAGYPKFYNKENWAAFTGEFEDSFGIGVYVKGEEEFLAGVFSREETDEKDPSNDDPTSYIAIIKSRTFRSFEPFQYEYYLATGNAGEIREAFRVINESK